MTELRLSGGENNSSPNFSLGGAESSTAVEDDMNHNLFDAVSKLEIINETEEFRCIYIHNDEGHSIRNVIVKKDEIEDFTEIEIGVEDGEAQIISSERITPRNIVFYNLKDYDYLSLPIGVVEDGEAKAIWIKRILKQGVDEGKFSLTVEWYEDEEDPSETFSDKGSFAENISTTSFEHSYMGNFRMGEGVMT